MDDSTKPALSVVLVTPGHFDTIRTTLRFLRAQTIRDQLELIIVATAKSMLGPVQSELQGFCRVHLVEFGPISSIGRANAAGVRCATAPLVVFSEDHAFPEPTWAAALVAAHDGTRAAVGPLVANANPRTLVAWADFVIGYGPWMAGQAGGARDFLPGHNSSYRRDLLVDYGQRLEELLEAETILHWDLRRRGLQLWLEPSARIAHVNFSRPSSWLRAQFHGGRLFAGRRAQLERWPWVRRFLFAGGSPLIPVVRFWRLVRQRRPAGPDQPSPFLFLAVLMVGLTIDGLGQLLG